MSTLQAAINTPSGEYIKGFEATITEPKSQTSKAGKTFFKAVATDGQHKAYLTSWGQTFEHVNGKRVSFSGMGIQRKDDYNGNAQISISEKAKFKTVGDAEAPSAPASTPSRPSTPPAVAGARPEGQSVGNALTNATQLAIKHGIDSLRLESFLFETCSIYLTVSRRLMNGELATDKPDRAANPAQEQDSDVPF
jgi:hypothetical protein